MKPTPKTELFVEANARITLNVKKWVRKRGWTLETLAFESDLDKGNLYNAINGNINFTLRSVLRMSEALDVDFSELFKK